MPGNVVILRRDELDVVDSVRLVVERCQILISTDDHLERRVSAAWSKRVNS